MLNIIFCVLLMFFAFMVFIFAVDVINNDMRRKKRIEDYKERYDVSNRDGSTERHTIVDVRYVKDTLECALRSTKTIVTIETGEELETYADELVIGGKYKMNIYRYECKGEQISRLKECNYYGC